MEAALTMCALLCTGCIVVVSFYLSSYLGARAKSEQLYHKQVEAGEQAIRQIGDTIQSIQHRYEKVKGN